MKRLIIPLLLASIGCVAGALWAGWHQAGRSAGELQTQQAAWVAQRAELEAALAEARARQAKASFSAAFPAAPVLAAQAAPGPDAQALLDRLAGLREADKDLRKMLENAAAAGAAHPGAPAAAATAPGK